MADFQDDFLDRTRLAELQNAKLARLLNEVLPRTRFYKDKIDTAAVSDWPKLPFTTKSELLADQAAHPPYGSVLTEEVARYCRLHQTSGTSGRPLRWLDTAESWNGLLNCWDTIYRVAGVTSKDRLFFPFSFGPFLGFWTAFEAAVRQGWFCLPGGGMSSAARLRLALENCATVLFCTPTYALRLAEVGQEEKMDLRSSAVRLIIVAGEPGGCIQATRQHIEAAWGARVLDHYGLTEVGPAAIECPDNPAGLHILETDYLAEVVDSASGSPLSNGETGELVITTLTRTASPLLRYRTGDLAKIDPRPCPCGRALVRLAGGILGRVDDMIHLRGNNVYPSALEDVVRRFPEVAEFRYHVDRSGPLADLRIELEAAPGHGNGDLPERVGRAIQRELLFRAEVAMVPPGTLPRFEMKARRLVVSGQ